MKTKEVRGGLKNQADHHLSDPLARSHSAKDVAQVNELSRWFLILPVVVSLIFASAHLGLLIKYHFAFSQPRVDLAAKYEPWTYMLIHAVRPEIVKEIRLDRANGSKSAFQDPVIVNVRWVDDGAKDDPIATHPTQTPVSLAGGGTLPPKETFSSPTHTPTPSQTFEVSPTPIGLSTSTSSSSPSSTPLYNSTATITATASLTPTFIPTGTMTPVPSSTSTTQPTNTPTPTAVPTASSTPGSAYSEFSNFGVFASSGTMSPTQGSISVWLNFEVGHARSDHMVVHTDDSRWVLYIDTFYSSGLGRNILSIAARAGGNKSASSSSTGHSGYPEARLLIDNDGSLQAIGYGESSSWIGVEPFPEGEWHHLGMTWNGYPSGTVRLYLDGALTSYLPYGPGYDDGQPLHEMFSFGFKPAPWPSIGDLPEIGDVGTGRLVSGGIMAADLRIYLSALSAGQILQVANAGIGG